MDAWSSFVHTKNNYKMGEFKLFFILVDHYMKEQNFGKALEILNSIPIKDKSLENYKMECLHQLSLVKKGQ